MRPTGSSIGPGKSALPVDALSPPPDGLPAWAIVSTKRHAHILRVEALMQRWAEALTLPSAEVARWRLTARLHDALRSAPVAELQRWVPLDPGPAELLHGPAAAEAARQHGDCTDAEVLDAVRWHTVGSTTWGALGRALYCADYLEPGRDFHRRRRRELATRYPEDPVGVLREVAGWRRHFADDEGWEVPAQTRQFWESLEP